MPRPGVKQFISFNVPMMRNAKFGSDGHHYVAYACSRYNARCDWPVAGHYSPVMPTDRLRGPQNQSKKPYNKKRINLERSISTGKSQTSALRQYGNSRLISSYYALNNNNTLKTLFQ